MQNGIEEIDSVYTGRKKLFSIEYVNVFECALVQGISDILIFNWYLFTI